jgi:hypothetical protein
MPRIGKLGSKPSSNRAETDPSSSNLVKSSMNFKPAFKPKPRPVPKSTPAVATPDTSTPNSPAIATAVETAEGSVLGVPAVQDHRDEIPQENANRETDQAGNVSTENPPPESSSQQPTTQEAPLNQAQPISPPFTAPSILTQPHLHFPSQSTPGPSSPSSPSQSDPKHVVPIIPGISANDFPHRMTEAQLRPTSGFVLPDVQDVGGGTGRKPVRRVDSAGKEKADDEEEGSQGEEEDVEAKNNKKSKDKGKGKGKGKGKAKVVRASTDEPEQATGEKRKRSTRNPKPIIDPSLEQDLDSQSGSGSSDSEDYSTGYHSRSPSPSQNTSGGKPSKGSKRKRNPKRMRVDMKDDLTPIQLEYLQPGEAIGEPIDEARMTMADLASVPGEGRISGKAIRIQQGREEILRRKEEEVGKRVRWRVEREMKMRGPAGVEPDERGGMDGPDQGQGQGDEDGEGEEDEDEGLDEEDKDDEGSERPTALKPMRTDEYGNILEDDEDVEILPTLGEGGKTVDPLAAESDDDEEDTYEYTNNRTGIQMSLDADGNMVINNTIDRAQLLRDRMDEGEAIEENDDLKFTNMMSHSKRAATIRWSKDMKSKLMLVSWTFARIVKEESNEEG